MPRALASLLLLAAALGGCLGYGDKDVVADVIRQTYTQRNVADCTDRETRRFAEQTTLFPGTGAVVMCRTLELKVEPAKSVVVSGVRVQGDTATARVIQHGGAADGRRETVRLVKSSNGWKLDRIVALKLSRRAIDDVYGQLIEDAPVPAAQRECMRRAIHQIPIATLERATLASDNTAIVKASGRCFSASSEQRRR